MAMTMTAWIEIASVAGTLIVGGMKFGAMDSRLLTLEQKKDQTEDVASVKAQVEDLKSDMSDLKSDVRDIKLLLLKHH